MLQNSPSAPLARRTAVAAATTILVAATVGLVVGLVTQHPVNGTVAGMLVALVGAAWVSRCEHAPRRTDGNGAARVTSR